MSQVVADSVANPRFSLILLAAFAGVALLLAAVGIYGVISCSVNQGIHEVGVRMALGARPRDVFRLVVGKGLGLAGIGVGVGTVGAFVLTRFLQSLLFGVSATDPATFASIAAVLMGAAGLACYVPARRAARVEPMVVLRYE